MRNSLGITALAAVAAAAAGAAGFSAAVILQGTKTSAPEDVSAHCALYASDTARADSIRIRCGLDRAGIEEVLRAALDSLGIDPSLSGENADADALQAAADRLNVTMEALTAVLEGQSGKGAAREDRTPPVEVLVEVADPPTEGGGGVPSKSPSAPSVTTIPIASVADEELLADAVGRVELDCALTAGKVSVREVAIDCGPKPEEITDLVQQFVEASGAENLRDAIARDERARSDFVKALANYYHLEEQVVDELVAELVEAHSPWSGEAGDLDAALQSRLQRALAIVRIGQVAEQMQRRQVEVAEALVSGEDLRADAAIRAAGEELRPIADEFAPVDESPTVVAARLIEEADVAYDAGTFDKAADGYARAANLMSRNLISDALRIMAVDALELSDRNPGDYLEVATEFRLRSAEGLASAAVRAGINAAVALRQHGGGELDDSKLEEAQSILERLAMSSDPDIDPDQHFAVHDELARLTLLLADRSREPDLFRKAATAASIAVDSARALGDAALAEALITWGNTQLNLADHLGESSALTAAAEGYRDAVDLLDPERDVGNWSAATANLAIVQRRQAFEEEDPQLLEDAIATYRDLQRRVEVDSTLWQGVSTNYATSLLDLGLWRRDEERMREAVRQLERVLKSYEEEQNAWKAFETRQLLAAAWRQIGKLTQSREDFARAAQILADLQQVEGIEQAIGLWVRLKVEQASLHEELGRLSGGSDEFLTAAGHYSEARAPFEADEVPLLYAELALHEAEARRAAHVAGASEDERQTAAKLAQRALELVDGQGTQDTEWNSVRETAAALLDQLDGGNGG